MIQSIMLAAMGFIAASLLALLIAPAFWSRAVRLTSQRLRGALPLSEQEIRADKDLLRAEYALKVYQLEREVEQVRLAAHRQQIEINRRDIEIRRISESLALTETSLSEHRNARSVLEQTVTERIPVLESSLAQARDVLRDRDASLDQLQATADMQAAALEDGRAILTQRALEVQRLQALFQEASAHGRDVRGESSSDGLALRAEIESLKARLAERAAVIDRLQSEVAARPRSGSPPALGLILPDNATPEQMRAQISEQTSEIAQLRRDLIGRPRAGEASAIPADDRELTARRLQDLERQLTAQTDEAASLRAENQAIAMASDPVANARVRESKLWLHTRVDRIEGELARERDVTARLRAELAAANERFARQGAQFRDELRRQPSRPAIQARDVLRDSGKPAVEAAARPAPPTDGEAAAPRPVSSRARELQRALLGQFGQGEPAVAGSIGQAPSAEGAAIALPAPNNDTTPVETITATGESAASEGQPDSASRGRLLDRLKSYEQA